MARPVGDELDQVVMRPMGRARQQPVEDLSNTESLSMLLLTGRLYGSLTVDEIGNQTAERPMLYWERRPSRAPGAQAPENGN